MMRGKEEDEGLRWINWGFDPVSMMETKVRWQEVIRQCWDTVFGKKLNLINSRKAELINYSAEFQLVATSHRSQQL